MKKKILLELRDGIRLDDQVLQVMAHGCEIITPRDEAELFVAIGGDRTLNSSIRKHWQMNKPFFGWHQGDKSSVGFHLNPVKWKYLKQFFHGQIDWFTMHMMEIQMIGKDRNDLGLRHAYGDCYFRESGGGIILAQLNIAGEKWINPIAADGVLVCTGAGSTAYNASIGGPIKALNSHGLIVNAISPQPRFHWRPRVLDSSEKVLVKLVNTERRSAKLYVDGRVVKLPVEKIIVQQIEETVTLGFARSYDFRQKLVGW